MNRNLIQSLKRMGREEGRGKRGERGPGGGRKCSKTLEMK